MGIRQRYGQGTSDNPVPFAKGNSAEPELHPARPIPLARRGRHDLGAAHIVRQRAHCGRYDAVMNRLGNQSLVELDPLFGTVLGIAAQKFVCAFSGKDHFHLARRHMRQHHNRNIGRFGRRCAATQNCGRPALQEVVRLQHDFLVIGVKLTGDGTGVIKLRVAGFTKAD